MDTGHDTDPQLLALHHLERSTEKQIYTGPDTGPQLMALRHLEYVAAEQRMLSRRDAAVVPTFTPTARPARPPQRGIARAARDFVSAPWPLYAVLAVQAVLSLRLIWGNTAFLDEATYIWAGRVELWHLTAGTPTPAYSTYFSGAPVIYPPLAGLADMAGGLTAARLLSLALMLGVTCMLWGSARSLFGLRAAVCAVALFAAIGSTQFLGALATYDPMALFFLTVSARLVIAARNRPDSTMLLLGAAGTLVLANATKYATGIFDPVIVAIAVFSSPRGIKAGLARGGLIAAVTIALIAVLLAIGGPFYLAGIESTTLSRAVGTSRPSLVLTDSVRWVGIVVVLAGLGLALAWWRDREQTWLFAVLMVAGVLAPLNQARIHTTVSLLKHVDFGAWFACLAAGYAIATVTKVSHRQWLRGAVAAAAAAVILLPADAYGREQAAGFDRGWVNTTQFTAELRSLVRTHPGIYLAEDYEVPGMYLDTQVTWENWQSTWYFGYRPPGSRVCLLGSTAGLSSQSSAGSAIGRAFTQAVRHGYFALIVLNFTATPGIDHAIESDIQRDGNYQVVAEIPFTGSQGQFIVWARTGTAGGGARGASC